jgi:hypothetical protein
MAVSSDGVFHTNRKPLSCMKKLRPKNPLFLAVIEEAWYDDKADNSPWLDALAELRQCILQVPLVTAPHTNGSQGSAWMHAWDVGGVRR